MRTRGMHLSFEALFSLLILVMLISTPLDNKGVNLEDIYVLQKQHDLIKIWVHERDFSDSTLSSDFEFVFPGKAGTILLGEREIEIGEPQNWHGKSIAKAYYLDSGIELAELRLIVFH